MKAFLKLSFIVGAGFLVQGTSFGADMDASAEPADTTPAEFAPLADFFIGTFYQLPDKNRGTSKRSQGWEVGLGIPLIPHLSVELNAFTTQLDTASASISDFYQRGGGANLVYSFARPDQFNPFIMAGLGAVYDDVLPEAAKSTNLYGDAGVGFTQPLFGNPWTKLRGTFRYVRDNFDGGKNDFQLGLGLQVSLGNYVPKVIVKEVKVPVEVIKIVEKEVPAAPVVPAGPLDSDGDGITDAADQCPHTPAGSKVLPNGCALQNDCRTPQAGEKVDSRGCAVDHNFVLRGVQFEFNSDRLTEAAKLILKDVADTLKANPDISVEVQGHTDNIGSDAYNMGLSERRANSARSYLIGRGAEASHMRPIGYGETQPMDTNETELGRENNRRVELKVIE